jgi:hypothetical protein
LLDRVGTKDRAHPTRLIQNDPSPWATCAQGSLPNTRKRLEKRDAAHSFEISRDWEAMNFSYTCDFLYIDFALKSYWQPFNDLVVEMESFVPLPHSHFSEQRASEIENYKSFWTSTSAELEAFVDQQLEARSGAEAQFNSRFLNRLMTQYVTVAMLSQALCEAGINAIMAIGLAANNSPELLTLLERSEIKEKWRVGPKALNPEFDLPKGEALWETLRHLITERNALMHYRIDLHIENKKILDGTALGSMSVQDRISWTKRYFSLPYDLAIYAQSQLKAEQKGFILMNSAPIATAVEHRACLSKLQLSNAPKIVGFHVTPPTL